jgi:hypothetical protein
LRILALTTTVEIRVIFNFHSYGLRVPGSSLSSSRKFLNPHGQHGWLKNRFLWSRLGSMAMKPAVREPKAH